MVSLALPYAARAPSARLAAARGTPLRAAALPVRAAPCTSRAARVRCAAASPASPAPGPAPPADWTAAARTHLALALDGKARLALPQGALPAEGVGPFSNIVWAFLGCFLSMAALGLADVAFFAPRGLPFIMGSFGTISVLYFGAGLRAPVLRLWSVVVGHLCAAAFACIAVTFIEPLWLARALGLACSVAFMLWTGAVHPPGGALVLIFADSAQMQALGWRYMLFPGLFGALVLMAFAAATDELKRRFVFELADVASALRLRAPQPQASPKAA